MATPSKDYDFTAIEPKWQSYWAENKTYESKDFEDKPTFYVLDMFPYPSGAGLHIGHPEGLHRKRRPQALQESPWL